MIESPQRMWIFFIALPGAILGLNLFLAYSVRRLFAGRRALRAAATIVVLGATALFALAFVGFLLHRHDAGVFGFAWEFLAFGVVPAIYLALWAAAGMLSAKIFPRLARFKYAFAGTGVVLVAAVCAHGFWKFEHPRVRSFAWIPEEKRFVEQDAGTPKAPGTLRIVATADWHLGTRIGRARAEKFVALVNAQNPDVVVIAGDLIDGDIAPVEAERSEEALRKIDAPLGVFATLGNHEYFGDLTRDFAFIRRAGIRMLRDASASVPADGAADARILFVGRDDATNRSRAPIASLLSGRPENVPAFVIDHQPKGSAEAVAAGADFVFSGHTHAGQLWPVTWLVGLFNPHVYGVWNDAGTLGYVTSGIGLWQIPYRIGCSSELVVIDVH